MSTPATYLFIGHDYAPVATTVYLHLDGDQHGAANYFRAMLAAEEGPSAVAFIRANKQASLVSGHDVWSNTHYRYTLDGEQLLAEKRLVEYEEGWETVFQGRLADFINNQPGPMIHRHTYYEGGQVFYFTYEQISAKVRQAQQALVMAAGEQGQRNLSRCQQQLEEAKALQLAAFRLEEFGETVGA